MGLMRKLLSYTDLLRGFLLSSNDLPLSLRPPPAAASSPPPPPLILLLLLLLASSGPDPRGPLLPTGVPGPDPAPLPLASGATPSCSLLLLSHSFASTYGNPRLHPLLSPPCASKSAWATAVLSFSAASQGDQYDRIAAVWLGGAELLRTSTPEPTPAGIFWTVQKDVTRYAASSATTTASSSPSCSRTSSTPPSPASSTSTSPSPSIPPMPMPTMRNRRCSTSRPMPSCPSRRRIPPPRGFWFRIANGTENNARKTLVAGIPPNTYRAALEVFASAHGDDEFWYSNPPDSYIEKNNLTTRRGNAAFREIVVSVDGQFAGSVVPFPVIFAGGINPLFWVPVVGLGAFDLPSYTLDLTPFLGLLLDRNKSHEIGSPSPTPSNSGSSTPISTYGWIAIRIPSQLH
uniref:Peptide N-acetyl-beta-D-glucosaminyl asparaginase amidase A N-terminal domain-containing protein n=1 Tax=Ananas comosus var. bracteatus TaxID=296719 RepID=A0A6V7Q9Z8_ANACO|nr:unnamed protein product [Ananas comosus var. bracteatus]